MEKKIYFTPIRRFVSFLELQKHNSIVTQNNFIIYFIILLFTTFHIQSSLWTIVVSQFYCLLLSIFSQLTRIFKKIRENYIQFPIIQFVYTLHRHNTHKIKYNGTQVLARFFCFCLLDSSLNVHIYNFRGVLLVYWACKVFNGSKDQLRCV